jgi:type I restriction enzyme S subunit
VLNQHIFRVVPKKGVDKYWLYLALQVATRRIESNAHGFKSSLVHVQKDDITNQAVDLPPLPEQRKIAEILRTWDEAIAKLEALHAHKAQRLDALRDMLMARGSRVGVPTTFGAFLKESRIPGGDGSTARKITVKLYGKGAAEKSEQRSGSTNTRYYRRKAGQIIWSKLDFLNGAFALLRDELDDYESTLDLPAFDCAAAVNPHWFIEYLIRPSYYTQQVHLARGQRKARRIAPEDWLASPIRLPDRSQQDRISEIIATARCEVETTGRSIEALRNQKSGLMQKLLTGEWRVSP